MAISVFDARVCIVRVVGRIVGLALVSAVLMCGEVLAKSADAITRGALALASYVAGLPCVVSGREKLIGALAVATLGAAHRERILSDHQAMELRESCPHSAGSVLSLQTSPA